MFTNTDPYVILGVLVVFIPAVVGMFVAVLLRNAPPAVNRVISTTVSLIVFVLVLYFGLTYLGFFDNPLFH